MSRGLRLETPGSSKTEGGLDPWETLPIQMMGPCISQRCSLFAVPSFWFWVVVIFVANH